VLGAEASHARQWHDARIGRQTGQQLRCLGVLEQPVDELAAIRTLAEVLHVDDRVVVDLVRVRLVERNANLFIERALKAADQALQFSASL
jgi:hypothetical protein